MRQDLDRTGLIWHQAKTKDDAACLAELARAIWTEHYTPIIGPEQVTYMLERFQSSRSIYLDMTQRGFTYIWLAVNGRPIAYMAWQDCSDRTCFLSKLYVLRAWRGQGLARLLVAHLLTYCRQENLEKIWLTVNKHNANSIQAYKKMMFRITDVVVQDIGEGYVMDDYVMQRAVDL